MNKKLRIIKEYSKSKSICNVTFYLPKEGALTAETVTVVGDFNDWDKKATPMRLQKNGDFIVVVELEAGREYHFRYCINDEKWENDWCADKYEPNPFGGYDSVVVV
jgi:1,4-alpha-glucan branching enzyme